MALDEVKIGGMGASRLRVEDNRFIRGKGSPRRSLGADWRNDGRSQLGMDAYVVIRHTGCARD